MQDHHVIHPSYYCGRERPGGPILVYTTGAYVVAQYDERTGLARWQRVVQASQRATIEKWLNEHFPKPAVEPPPKSTKPNKRAAKAGK